MTSWTVKICQIMSTVISELNSQKVNIFFFLKPLTSVLPIQSIHIGL